MEIKVLGMGCSRCKLLEKTVKDAVNELGLDTSVERVDDIQKIMGYGIMRTPGLVINGKVVLSGQVPGMQEMKELLNKNR